MGKSLQRRSQNSVCYGKLLRNFSPIAPSTHTETGDNNDLNCYGKLLRELPRGVFDRGGRYYYRKTVPIIVQRLTGRVEIWRSLKTDSLSIALRRLPFVSASIEAEFELSKRKAGLPVDETLFRPLEDDWQQRSSKTSQLNTLPTATQKPSSSLTFSDAYERYLTDPTHNWSDRTKGSYETSRRIAVSAIGPDLLLTELSRNHCRSYIEVLRYLPRNASKRFPKLSPRQASERAKLQNATDLISVANINVYLGDLSSFLNWSVNEELLDRNPARGLRLPDNTAKRHKRHPFSVKQLKTIFNAPLYRGCRDGMRGYSTTGVQRPRNARFWVPLIALHTGMRLNEICQLDMTDIRKIEGIPCVVVSKISLIGSTDKILKTGVSERIVPVHQNLIDCGLIQFVEQQKRSGKDKLFHEITTGANGIRAIAFSKWFTKFLRKCGANRERTCFHSFRHNFRDELRFAHIDHDIAMMLGGWTTNLGGRTGASDSYGAGHKIQTLLDAVRRLKFADLDISHLKTED